MRKGKSIIGLRLISQSDGADLGTVQDLIFDHESDELVALMVSGKDLFGLIDATVVPWHQVSSIGHDAVMVQSSESKIKAHDDARVAAILDRETKLSGTKIYTTDGRDIGTLADMYIDEATGRVLGYEVSGGFVSDTMSGKSYMQAPREIRFGDNVALVPPSVGDELEAQKQEQPGGLKGAASSAGDKVSSAYGTVKEKATDTYASLAASSVEKQKDFVVGKTASRDVVIPADKATMATPGAVPEGGTYVVSAADLTAPTTVTGGTMSDPAMDVSLPTEPSMAQMGSSPMSSPMASDVSSAGALVEGEVLVRTGEIITREHANRAESAGVLGQLLLSATGGAAADATSGMRGQAGEHAADMGDKAEEAAIGKPAGYDVNAPDGSTLVASGMVITRTIIEQAKLVGKDKQVIAAAGVGAASAGAQSAASTVQEHASGLFGSLKEKVADLTGAAHEKKAEYDAAAEQSKINNALGRPTTRVILDQSDAVILNTGDLITHAAVNRAREAGVLEILLDSVYTADPEITPEMLRASEPGEAALPTQAQPTGGPITATVMPDQPAQDSPSQGATG